MRLKNNPLVILAENYAPDHPYVRKVRLNDTLLDRTWLRHSEIEGGGVLRFEMGADTAKQ